VALGSASAPPSPTSSQLTPVSVSLHCLHLRLRSAFDWPPARLHLWAPFGSASGSAPLSVAPAFRGASSAIGRGPPSAPIPAPAPPPALARHLRCRPLSDALPRFRWRGSALGCASLRRWRRAAFGERRPASVARDPASAFIEPLALTRRRPSDRPPASASVSAFGVWSCPGSASAPASLSPRSRAGSRLRYRIHPGSGAPPRSEGSAPVGLVQPASDQGATFGLPSLLRPGHPPTSSDLLRPTPGPNSHPATSPPASTDSASRLTPAPLPTRDLPYFHRAQRTADCRRPTPPTNHPRPPSAPPPYPAFTHEPLWSDLRPDHGTTSCPGYSRPSPPPTVARQKRPATPPRQHPPRRSGVRHPATPSRVSSTHRLASSGVYAYRRPQHLVVTAL
jgi:hypothetical protein